MSGDVRSETSLSTCQTVLQQLVILQVNEVQETTRRSATKEQQVIISHVFDLLISATLPMTHRAALPPALLDNKRRHQPLDERCMGYDRSHRLVIDQKEREARKKEREVRFRCVPVFASSIVLLFVKRGVSFVWLTRSST